ncbi:MAG TPA: cation:proton antiporter [Flavobacterium sp.]|jgi:NhaP-type Na+/H+ or K+/H+ antiporter
MIALLMNTPDPYNLHLILWGMITLLAATIPNLLKSRNITAPIIYMVIGIAIYLFTGNYSALQTFEPDTIKKICEFVVLISLVNAGLKIRDPFSWRTWKHSFYLLVITMPLTIIAATFVGSWILGLAPASALLFGAIISPTDPVLAADLQTSRPSKKDISKTRLALTSEAGINDGLAFPFVYFALHMAEKGTSYGDWLQQWILIDVFYKVSIGAAIGMLFGWLFYRLIFTLTAKDHHSKISRGILSLSLTLIPYAVTEIVGGYGFIAVFLAACVFSNSEKIIHHMDSLHDFTEEIERIFVAVLFVMIGIFVCANWTQLLDIKIISTALILLLVVRPLFGWLALSRSKLSTFEKFVMSFYGIRGVGSIFYLMYALGQFEFHEAPLLIKLTATTITLSVLIHGISAATIQKRLDDFDTH